MTVTDNQLPIVLQPIGDICIPVSVPNDTEWLWLLVKCLSFPSARRFWIKGNETNTKIVMDEWDSRVYNPLVDKVIAGILCAESEEDNCVEYPTQHGMIDWQPMNPFSEAGTIPDGYLLPPFVTFVDMLADDFPDWLANIVAEIVGEFTGYEPTDVLTLIGCFPLDITDWQGALENGLPRFTVTVQDKGTLELHLLTVPFGGMALITVNVEPNIPDIISGIISEDVIIVELERDLSSVPPELNTEVIHEVDIDTVGENIIHVTFIPNLDAAALPIRFGGGLRAIVWCADNEPEPEPCPDCDIETVLEDETFFIDEYVPQNFGTTWENTQTAITALETAYDDTPQSIGAEIPVGAPNDAQKYALCAAIKGFLQMYAAQKIAMIQSKNFLQIAWDKVVFAATQAFDTALDVLLGLFGFDYGDCAIDANEAITALSDNDAISELQCELLELIDSAAITETLFNDSIEALTLLTGNAQKIACMLSNDNNTQIYLRFLEIYNSKLIQEQSGNELDCECITASYRVKTYDFRHGLNGWRFIYIPNTSNTQGTVTSDGLLGSVSGSVNIVGAVIAHNPAWRVHGYRVLFSRDGAGLTANDLGRLFFRPNPDSTLAQANLNPSGGNVAGSNLYSCAVLAPSTNYGTGYNQILINFQCNSPASENITVHKIEIWYMDGFAPDGCYATTDDNPCT